MRNSPMAADRAGLTLSSKGRILRPLNAFKNLIETCWVESLDRLLGNDVHVAVDLSYPESIIGSHSHDIPSAVLTLTEHQLKYLKPDYSSRIGILNDLFYGRSYIAAPTELSISFLLDEKSTLVPVRLAGE